MIAIYDPFGVLTRFGLAVKVAVGILALYALLSLVAFGGYFLFGAAIMCETQCSPLQAWIAFGLAVAPLLLLISVVFGAIAVFARTSAATFALAFIPVALVELVKALDSASLAG